MFSSWAAKVTSVSLGKRKTLFTVSTILLLSLIGYFFAALNLRDVYLSSYIYPGLIIVSLIWIISFVSYLSITLKFSTTILKKLTNIKNSFILTCLLGFALLIVSILPKDYSVSTHIANIVYKYSFFILVIGISFLVLLFSVIKQKIRKWFK